MKLLPGLFNFTKSNDAYKLEPFSRGIYKLKKYKKHQSGNELIYLVFSYKLKRTKYEIYSSRAVTKRNDGGTIFINGKVVVRKGFKKYELSIEGLDSTISNSICANMDKFNELLKKYNKEEAVRIKTIKPKKDKLKIFIKDLDV